MAMPDTRHWQIQEAKQRFSEVIRAATQDGPQIVTRHGEDVAVIVDIAEYHRLTSSGPELTRLLLGGPKLAPDMAAIFEEVEAARESDFGREIDLGADA